MLILMHELDIITEPNLELNKNMYLLFMNIARSLICYHK